MLPKCKMADKTQNILKKKGIANIPVDLQIQNW